MDATTERFMRRALWLAERGGGRTAPNPMVGCVIADPGGRILGEGWHVRAGDPHAEVAALESARAAGHAVTGATAVVTLEPCAAHGRTPPCAGRLAAEGVARVVYALDDPASGRGGAAELRAAGIAVERGILADDVEFLLEPWLHFVASGRTFVHLKTAQTLSGHVTRGSDGARWITGPRARAAVHRLRRRYPAVLIGVGTALADDPSLTVRDWPPAGGLAGDPVRELHPWPDVQPFRAVVDTALRTPADGRLAGSAASSPVIVFAGEDAPEDRARPLRGAGVEVVRIAASSEGLDLRSVLAELAARDVTGVLVEAGPTLAGSLLDHGLVDRWTVFLAPDWSFAPDARPAFPSGREGALRLEDVRWSVHGRDAAVTGRVHAE